jgi:predicted ATPase
LATEQGFVVFAARGTFDRGYALVEQGKQAEGISLMRQSLTNLRAIGSYPGHSLQLARLAEACGKAGQADEGFTLLTEALAFMNEHEERVAEAELYRLKGALTLQKGARDWGLGAGSSSPQAPSLKSHVPMAVVEEAEGYFLKAIEIAQKQQAKSWELRASTSLAQLWQRQGKKKDAHTMLSKIYHWFSEGFDTRDLQEAQALLAELRQ